MNESEQQDFTFDQVKYILYHYYELSHGWFPEKKNGNKEARIPHRTRAGFEEACLLAAEIGLRVKRCGRDGKIVEAMFMGQEGTQNEKSVAVMFKLTPKAVRKKVDKVVAFATEIQSARYREDK